MKRGCLIGCGVLLAAMGAAQAGDWPQFRGPAGTGIAEESGLPVHWGPTKNVAWKAKLPGPGNSSPIVSAGRVFITCAQDQGRRRMLFCFDRRTGEQLWVKTVQFDKVMPTHKANPYCASTPAADGERVVVWHGSAGLYCYDFEGRELWHRDLGEFRHIWGYAASPVLYKGRVILHCGPGKRVFVTAIDLKTGRTIWETDEPVPNDGITREDGKWIGSWSTPLITQVDGRDQILVSMPTRVVAYDPETGEILWFVEGLRGERGDLVYTSIVVGDGVGVAMGGYRGPAIGFRLGGRGNVTKTNRLWRIDEGTPQRIGSGVIVDGVLYMANAGPGYLEAIDPETGKQLWRARGTGANHWGSVVFGDGRLYVTGQNGTTLVFAPNPDEFELIATNRLGEPSNSTPALSDGAIFIRTAQTLWCIRETE